ncbi:MAG TPA: hypothetical protein VHP14_16540, partial [Anaerolineales bacterium]|nr:hypothetical protein [Anaerolineales bacterium]
MLEQPFSQATLGIVSAIGALLEHTHLTARARQVLQFAQIVLRQRFRYAIEIEETPSIALGEFDIEID